MALPAIALMHGGGQGSWVWEPLLPHLGHADIIALDVPGCGSKRGWNVGQIDADAIVAELVEDIRQAGLDGVLLVGHSLAGGILPRMAALQPRLFSRLVYLSCSAPLPGVTFLGQLGSGLHGSHPDEVGWPVDLRTTDPDERYRAMFCNDMNEAEADAFLSCLGKDDWPWDVFRRTDLDYDHLAMVPSTYILCQQDQSLPPVWQQRFAQRLHCVRIVSIDAGHQAMITAPQELARLILAEAQAD